MHAKDSYKAKYQYLINKREKAGIRHQKDPRACIEYLNDMHDVYKILMNTIPIKIIKIW